MIIGNGHHVETKAKGILQDLRISPEIGSAIELVAITVPVCKYGFKIVKAEISAKDEIPDLFEATIRFGHVALHKEIPRRRKRNAASHQEPPESSLVRLAHQIAFSIMYSTIPVNGCF